MHVKNQANEITRRCFADTDQMKALQRITGKAMSTCYQYTEEVGEFGNGRKSHLFVVIEEIRELYETGQREGWTVNRALEMARYPLYFLQKLMGTVPPDDNVSRKMDYLMKYAAEANCKLDGRKLADMSIDDMTEFKAFITDVGTSAFEIGLMIDEAIVRAESRFTGSPVQGERLARTG